VPGYRAGTGGNGAIGAGAAGAAFGVGAGPASEQALQCGQTHSTQHLRTGTSFVHGHFTNFFTSRTMHRHPQPSWQPLLQVSPHWPEPSPHPHSLQHRGVSGGMQMSLQVQQCLYSVTVFGSQ
jgi:hypothetical protein